MRVILCAKQVLSLQKHMVKLSSQKSEDTQWRAAWVDRVSRF